MSAHVVPFPRRRPAHLVRIAGTLVNVAALPAVPFREGPPPPIHFGWVEVDGVPFLIFEDPTGELLRSDISGWQVLGRRSGATQAATDYFPQLTRDRDHGQP